MKKVVISGTGLWNPPNTLSNDELVASYNAYADKYNQENEAGIANGTVQAKTHSSVDFIEKASGIKSRYIYIKEGVTDIKRMRPLIPARPDKELSDQAQMAISAARMAMKAAGKISAQIDAVIVSCAYTQRSYPAIAIEVQEALGIRGFAFDMLVACSSATFGIHRAYEMVKAETAGCVLVINPELTSPQVNYCDRDSHFIFGDVAVATIVESTETVSSDSYYEIIGTLAQTKYSNNIRSNFGYLMGANDTNPLDSGQLFSQNGRSVFKEVCPMAAEHIKAHLQKEGLEVSDIKRWWLHQANLNMNRLICKLVLNRDPDIIEAPIVLDTYANTASAGSLIAFHLHNRDLIKDDCGLICSFGAGYSIGSILVRKSGSS